MQQQARLTTASFGRWALPLLVLGSILLAELLAGTVAHADPTVIRAVMNGDLRSVDPHWTIVPQTRIHAYMVYDTLLGIDEHMQVRPQMAESWTESPDRLTYSFKLRDGLRFSDGAPVTSSDVIASYRRWSTVDAHGQALAKVLAAIEPDGPNAFTLRLREPFPPLLDGFAKVSAVPFFVMPARVVDGLPVGKPFTDPTGSGPFIMKRDEWVAGSKVVYLRNPDYQPRDEPASAIAGGKRVHVARVEWLNIPDAATQTAALQTGEVDFIQFAPPDLIARLRATEGIVVKPVWPTGIKGTIRLNWTNPPLDKAGIRRALQNFVHQPDMIMAVMGDMEGGQVCGSVMICGLPNGSEAGAELLLSSDPEEVRLRRGMQMMREAGYKGEPIVVLDSTDQVMQHNATLVMVSAMQKAGVNVDLQTVDWGTIAARRTIRGPAPNGWHIFFTTGGQISNATPAFGIQMPANCDAAFPGWPCDAPFEALRASWLKASDPAKASAIAVEIQRRAMEIGHSIPYGQYLLPAAWRDTLEGVVSVPEHVVFWNMRKRN